MSADYPVIRLIPVPAPVMARAPDPVEGRILDHVCRVCMGRLMSVMRDREVRIHCPNCGAEALGPVENLCMCGATTRTGRDAGLRCARNPNPTPDNPACVGVVYAGPKNGRATC